MPAKTFRIRCEPLCSVLDNDVIICRSEEKDTRCQGHQVLGIFAKHRSTLCSDSDAHTLMVFRKVIVFLHMLRPSSLLATQRTCHIGVRPLDINHAHAVELPRSIFANISFKRRAGERSVADSGKEVCVRVEAGKVYASINSDATTLSATQHRNHRSIRKFMVCNRMEVCIPVGITSSNKALVGEQGLVYRRHSILVSRQEMDHELHDR